MGCRAMVMGYVNTSCFTPISAVEVSYVTKILILYTFEKIEVSFSIGICLEVIIW